jgi:dihydroorotate dehydrogenase (NAD+) catalytic subunit
MEAAKGNPPPRIVETACGMLNAIGLENVGLEAFITEKLPVFRKLSTPVIANIYGTCIEDYAELAARIDELEEIAGIEVNISCPNVKAGGVAFGTDPDVAGQLVKQVRSRTSKPLMVKLSPNVTEIVAIAKSVEAAGADSLSLINTIMGMAVDIETRRPKLANVTGGLSGPAIKPVALRMVWQVASAVDVPVVGIGGIMDYRDALEFFIAGASAIQVGTANFVNPGVSVEIVEGIEQYFRNYDFTSMADIVGTLKVDFLK